MTATVLEPASEHGQKGMDELHEQTVNLLSFQELPKAVFDTQVAFNLAASYGPNSSSHSAVDRAARSQALPANHGERCCCSLRCCLCKRRFFTGMLSRSISKWRSRSRLGDLSQALAGEHVTVSRQAEDSPSNVNAAGQGDVLVSLARDDNNQNGVWIWAAADNFRIAAATAVECAETMTPTRPRGKIQ